MCEWVFRTPLQGAEFTQRRWTGTQRWRPSRTEELIRTRAKTVTSIQSVVTPVIAPQIGLSRHMTLVTDSAVLLQLCEASAVNETARGVRFGALIASVLYLLHLDRVLGQT
ncbi:hypothetical protein KUIN1_33770 [Pseudomonas sp. KUIN-1]|nr:hypothetical protein KUIN1_33770 [Pseudomonas sp. KUIN-1]